MKDIFYLNLIFLEWVKEEVGILKEFLRKLGNLIDIIINYTFID